MWPENMRGQVLDEVRQALGGAAVGSGAFDRFDADHSGKISMAEFVAAARAAAPGLSALLSDAQVPSHSVSTVFP